MTTTKTKSNTRKPAKKRTRKRRITPEDMKRFILVSDPQISPDGEKVLFTRQHAAEKNEKHNNLWIAETASGKTRQFTSSGKDGNGRWSPDGSKVAFISNRVKAHPQIYLMDSSGGEAVALTRFPEGTISGFKWSPDGRSLAVTFREREPDFTQEAAKKRKEQGLSDPPRVIDDVIYRLDGDGYFNGQRFHLYIVDVSSGDHRKVYSKDTLGWFSYDWSPDSREIVIATNTDRRAIYKIWNFRLVVLNVRTGKLRELNKVPAGIKDSVTWSPDGKYIAYAGQDSQKSVWGCENTHLFVCDSRTGETRKISRREDYCLTAITLGDTVDAHFGANIRWTRDSKKLYCRIGWHGDSHIAEISAKGGRYRFLTKGRCNWDFGNLSDDGKYCGAMMQTHTKLPEIHLVEFGKNDCRTRSLTNFNGKLLSELELSKPAETWITSEDGTKVHTWIMKPVGFRPNRRYPAVLEIHGGPHTQYGSAFFHEFQVLAANGYTVFFSNPRGSKGYGEHHCAVIRGDWGNKDWVDIQAVMNYMKEQPYVDSKHMGVMGGSYGGYMTNWVIGHTREFAGAITDRCVSNLVSMAGTSDFPNTPDEYWEGNAWDRPEVLWSQSPLAYLGNAKTPTLIIHSEGDLRCNIEQGEQVFTALKTLKVPTRFVRYPRSTFHGFSRGGPADLRIHRLEQILGWWKKYLH